MSNLKPSWLVLLFALTAALAGYTDTADPFPMNDAAPRMDPIKVSFVGTGSHEGLSRSQWPMERS